MKILPRVLFFMLIIFFMNNVLIHFQKCTVSAETKPARVAVFLLDFADDFISEIRQSLEAVQKENPDKVEYTFYDGKSNQAVQNEDISKVLNEQSADLILLNLVNRGDEKRVIDRIKEINIPVILFNREPLTPIHIQSYNKALYIGTNAMQAGSLQGEMLINVWNDSKKYIDKNKDDIMQFVMLQGEGDNTEAIDRAKYSISTIETAGIKTQQVSLNICGWRTDLAYNATKSLLERYKDQIEVIISNNDAMAIGAIQALQEYGYNNGEKLKTIPVVGIDGIPKARELIEKEYMLGSVIQDPKAYAQALYICGMNLIQGKNPIEGTKYTFDDTQVSVRIPNTEYLYKNPFTRKQVN